MKVDIPNNYQSIEYFANWMRANFPPVDGLSRWSIGTQPTWYVNFKNPEDATLFALKWI